MSQRCPCGPDGGWCLPSVPLAPEAVCGGSGATNEAIGVWDERRGKCGGLALGLEALDGIVHAVQLLERESIQLP